MYLSTPPRLLLRDWQLLPRKAYYIVNFVLVSASFTPHLYPGVTPSAVPGIGFHRRGRL